MDSEENNKPHLFLLPSEAICFETVMQMFEAIKGRPATAEERAEALREWQAEE